MQTQSFLPGFPEPVAQVLTPTNHLRISVVGERQPSVPIDRPHCSLHQWFSVVAAHPFFDPEKEHLAVFLLNARLRSFAWHMVSIGTATETSAHPREILRPAIAASACALILMHNHPSGDTDPSDADRRLTCRINSACELLQIRLVDHIICGRTSADLYYSFRQHGDL